MDNAIREQFPCFTDPNGIAGLVYFDSAATTQKPIQVLKEIEGFYLSCNFNVHRSSYQGAALSTSRFEATREAVKDLIGAQSSEEIIFTKGATEAINLVCNGLSQSCFKAQKRILISASEHHANLVPWQQIASHMDMYLDVIPVDAMGVWDTKAGLEKITADTVLVALGHVSNALGNINPIERFIGAAKSVGAFTLIDGAQAIAHLDVDVNKLDCDFYVFSAHKAYGPTGVGVLYGRNSVLANFPLYQMGGEMVKKVSFEHTSFERLPYRYEAGTPNIEGVVCFNAAVEFIRSNRSFIQQHESDLRDYLRQQLQTIDGVKVLGDPVNSIATVSFWVTDCNAHDIGLLLDQKHIAVRVGSHCAMPLMQSLKIEATVRVSMACYNCREEIDYLLQCLGDIVATLRQQKTVADQEPAFEPLKGGQIAENVAKASGWDGKYRQIMLAGKMQKQPPDDLCKGRNEVAGCESRVWVMANAEQQQGMIFYFYADSKIVRGLLAILLEPVQNRQADDIVEFDFVHYMAGLGLQHHLSESRANGLAKVIERVKLLASRYVVKKH